jgi:hypothetical protein
MRKDSKYERNGNSQTYLLPLMIVIETENMESRSNTEHSLHVTLLVPITASETRQMQLLHLPM